MENVVSEYIVLEKIPRLLIRDFLFIYLFIYLVLFMKWLQKQQLLSIVSKVGFGAILKG
jgi:hypothetical protein